MVDSSLTPAEKRELARLDQEILAVKAANQVALGMVNAHKVPSEKMSVNQLVGVTATDGLMTGNQPLDASSGRASNDTTASVSLPPAAPAPTASPAIPYVDPWGTPLADIPTMRITPSPAATVPASPGGAATPPSAPTKPPEVKGATPPSTSVAAKSNAEREAKEQADKYKTVEEIVQKAGEENVLNKYYQLTYHWRLFMTEDLDLVAQSGDIKKLNERIDSIKKVVIAETGITNFNIKEVRMLNTTSSSRHSPGMAANEVVITIVEANGVAFLDGLIGAAHFLGVKNYRQRTYYLELRFNGYDEDGKPATAIGAELGGGGRWTWAINCNTINTKLTETGSEYVLRFTLVDAKLLLRDDLLRLPTPIVAKGKNLGELFNSFITNFNTAREKNDGGKLYQYKIITHQIGKIFSEPASALDKDPKNFKLKLPQPDQNNARNWTMEEKAGEYTVTWNGKETIVDFILGAIKVTEEGQELAKGIPVPAVINQTTSQVTPQKFRQSILFAVEVDVKNLNDDTRSNTPMYEFSLHVMPTYKDPTLDMVEVKNSMTEASQKKMLQAYLTNGLFKKKYEYLFTGLNTEVLNFNMELNMAWNADIPALQGTLAGYDQVMVPARLNENNKQKRDGNFREATRKVEPDTQGATSQVSGGAPVSAPSSSAAPDPLSDGGDRSPSSLAETQALLESSRASSTSPNASAPESNRVGTGPKQSETTASPGQASTVYAEDFIDAKYDGQALPISFAQDNRSTDVHAPTNFVTGANRDSSMMGALFSQVYGTDFIIGELERIKMTIRGDPYWLGQANLQRSLSLRKATDDRELRPLSPTEVGVADWGVGCRVLHLLLRYPIIKGDNFAPVIQNSPIFSGIYEVQEVEQIFADGIFKQEITATRKPLLFNTSTVLGVGTHSKDGELKPPT